MKPRVTALLWMFVACLLSCSPSRNIQSSNPRESTSGDAYRILFLDYQISRDSNTGTYDAQLISMLIRDGKIKDSKQSNSQSKIGDLELLVLDKNQMPVSQLFIPNPLDKVVEYVNDARQLERRTIHLDSAQFNARLQIDPDAGFILLNRIIGDNHEESLLLKTPIL